MTVSWTLGATWDKGPGTLVETLAVDPEDGSLTLPFGEGGEDRSLALPFGGGGGGFR